MLHAGQSLVIRSTLVVLSSTILLTPRQVLAGDKPEVIVGNYYLSVGPDTTHPGIPEKVETLQCKNFKKGEEPKELRIYKENKYSWKGEVSAVKELSAELQAGVKIDAKFVNFETKLKAVAASRFSESRAHEENVQVSVEVREKFSRLQCFDIEVVALHDEETTEVSGKNRGWTYNSDVNFSLILTKDWRFAYTATFNPDCADTCKSLQPEGTEQVIDSTTGHKVTVSIDHKNGKYNVPLYHTSDWEIIGHKSLLPK